jgi:hypothetical protein
VHHERRRQVAAASHHRGAGVERRAHLAERSETGAGLLVEPRGGGRDGRQRVVGRAQDGVGLDEREIVDDDLDHVFAISRARRYIGIASSGRPMRSSTRPISW